MVVDGRGYGFPMRSNDPSKLSFVACASSLEVLGQHLLSSPCLRRGGRTLVVYFNAASAAMGFNAAMASELVVALALHGWYGCIRTYSCRRWDTRFTDVLAEALERFPRLAVAGVYGIAGTGVNARRAGHVLDRGTMLLEPEPLPCLVDSLDELLFAVRVDSGLQLDPALGFDFYATDLVLQAHAGAGSALWWMPVVNTGRVHQPAAARARATVGASWPMPGFSRANGPTDCP